MLPVFLADVQIEIAPVSPVLEGALARGVLWQAAAGRFLLDVPGVGRYLVLDGQRMIIEPAPGADQAEVARFLRLAPLAALFYQRGGLALHAAAVTPPLAAEGELGVRDGSGAVLIAGASGAGKSTLLAAFLQCGWRMLADELALVDLDQDGRLVVFPTFPEVRLWPDAIGALALPPISAETAAVFSFAGQLVPAPLPLRAIYWLSVGSQAGVQKSALAGIERFRAVGSLLYNSHVADVLLERAAYLSRAGLLAQTIPIYRLQRPRRRWCLEALMAQVNEV